MALSTWGTRENIKETDRMGYQLLRLDKSKVLLNKASYLSNHNHVECRYYNTLDTGLDWYWKPTAYLWLPEVVMSWGSYCLHERGWKLNLNKNKLLSEANFNRRMKEKF